MDDDILERLAIREVLDNWIVYSDGGDWERFRRCWHDDGRMMATWFQGSGDEFTEARKGAWDADFGILHFHGATSIDVAGERAITQTKMTISQRGAVHGVMCDIVCTGRFYDFFEKRDGRWAIVLRQPIYEKDRLDPIGPAAELTLDAEILARFPEGYRHLAYFQVDNGYQVKTDIPGLKGAAVAALYERGRAWLDGEAI